MKAVVFGADQHLTEVVIIMRERGKKAMRKCFERMSVLLAAILLLVGLPFMAARVKADDLPPAVPDFEISKDGIASWGEIDGLYKARVQINNGKAIYVYSPERQFDVKDKCASEGFASGSYTVWVTLCDRYGKELTLTSGIPYQYTCTGDKPTAVPKLVWNESQKKVTWKPSSTNANERYFVTVTRTNDEYSFCVDKPELPFYLFLNNGLNDVTISVRIRKYGCPDGDPATLSKSCTYASDTLPITLEDTGVVHWEWLPDATEVSVRWKEKGSTSGSSGRSFYDTKDTSCDIEEAVIRNHLCGKEISVEVTVYRQVADRLRVIAMATASYVSPTEEYSLKYMNTNLNSRNLKTVEKYFTYDPATKTLNLKAFDFMQTPYGALAETLFYAPDDLTVTGSASLYCKGQAFSCEKTLTFAKDSDILIVNTEAAPAVKADKVVLNGRNVLIHSQNGTAIQGTSSVTFGSAFREGRFISGSDGYAVGVSSSTGKISLGSAKIVLPSGGKLGADSRYIYESNGTTPAKNVSVRSSSYTAPSGAVPIDEEHFPSELFREIIDDKYIDRNMDDRLDKYEGAFVKTLYFYASNSADADKIPSLKGVEYFTELESLTVNSSRITSVDFSNNPKLTYLSLTHSKIDYIDISNNPFLVHAYQYGTKSAENTYAYRRDPNDPRLLTVEYLNLDAGVTIDIVGPTAPTDLTVEVGKSFQYIVSGITPTNFTWSVGNTSVATVDASGNVTGKSAGNTYLYAKLLSGKTYKCLIRVVYPPLSVRYSEKTLHINQTFAFTASGASGQAVTWSVGNTSVAAVDSAGKVTGKSAGNTWLYAKTADGRVAKCLLKVIDPGTLGIDYTEKTVYLGQTFTFTAKNAGILSVTWSVGNTAVAKVDAATGKVTPVSVGNTYLYAKTADGRSARCLIKVVDPGQLSIRYSEKTIKVGSSFKFTATNTAGQKVSWRVGNTAVATVDASGNVTGKKAANTYLYASTPDGREVKCLLRIVA